MEGQKTGALPGQEKPDGQQVRQLLGRQAAVIFITGTHRLFGNTLESTRKNTVSKALLTGCTADLGQGKKTGAI